jgi:hypothetical protein
MKRYQITYRRIPTACNQQETAVVETEADDEALRIRAHELGDPEIDLTTLPTSCPGWYRGRQYVYAEPVETKDKVSFRTITQIIKHLTDNVPTAHFKLVGSQCYTVSPCLRTSHIDIAVEVPDDHKYDHDKQLMAVLNGLGFELAANTDHGEVWQNRTTGQWLDLWFGHPGWFGEPENAGEV